MNKLNLKSMEPRPAQVAVPQRRKGERSEPDRSTLIRSAVRRNNNAGMG